MASNVRQIRATPIPDDRRSDPRVIVSVTKVSVRKISQQPTDALLNDLSIYGCRIKSSLDYRAGERVWLRFIRANPIPATVVWSEKGLAGCRFDVPIKNSLFRALTPGISP